MTRRLAVFDVDGTLLDSAGYDGRCFVEAFEVACGITGLSTDWETYGHCTDSWISREILRRARGREPTDADVSLPREAFFRLLERTFAEEPATFRQLGRAGETLASLPGAGWEVALGTGGWRTSALFKLRCAGIVADELPGGFAEDHHTRAGIMQAAIARASTRHGAPRTVVYVGDGRWDVRACGELGLPFVGIGEGASAETLRELGACVVLPDLSDLPAVIRALDEAEPPRD